jgi:hypothetical protein
MNFAQALRSLVSARARDGKAAASNTALPEPNLAGPGFVAQEPDLSKELHLTGRDVSGWVAGGSSLAD